MAGVQWPQVDLSKPGPFAVKRPATPRAYNPDTDPLLASAKRYQQADPGEKYKRQQALAHVMRQPIPAGVPSALDYIRSMPMTGPGGTFASDRTGAKQIFQTQDYAAPFPDEGSISSAQSPTWVERAYSAPGAAISGVMGLMGKSDQDRAREANWATEGLRTIGDTLGLDDLEKSVRRVAGAQGWAPPTAGDYLNVGLTVLPEVGTARKVLGRGFAPLADTAIGKWAGEEAPLFGKGLTGKLSDEGLAGTTAAAPRPTTGYGTYELTPGVMTGHRPDITSGSFGQRGEYTDDPLTSWTTPQGTDLLHDIAGFKTQPTLKATGVYEPEGHAVEFNPARIAPISIDRPSSDVLSSMRGIEALRAAADAQGGGAFSVPMLDAPRFEAGSLFIPHSGPVPLDQVLGMRDLTKKYGLPDVVDFGEGLGATQFWPPPQTGDLTDYFLKRGLRGDIEDIMPGADPQQAGWHSGYIDYEKAWKQPPGSGAVTNILQQHMQDMPPDLLDRFLKDPQISEAFANRYMRDQGAMAQGQQVRDDIQRSRDIVGSGDLSDLFAANAKGLPVMKAGGPVRVTALAVRPRGTGSVHGGLSVAPLD